MQVLSFRTHALRDDDERLRDAWIATQEFISSCDWTALQARCGLCAQTTRFRLDSDPAEPDVREGLVCERCGCNSRVRAALRLLLDQLPAESAVADQLDRAQPPQLSAATSTTVYLTEQTTRTYVWLQLNLPGTLHGSEYEPDATRREELSLGLSNLGGHGPVEFQDVTQLSFHSASLDAVVSFDVLEHVPDYALAIGEFARVLKPGGLCVATYPFNDRPDTLTRARLDPTGAIEHLQTPEYHGDPISGGILCFYHFGWDLLDRFRDAGFSDVQMVMPYGLDDGLPYGMWTLLARR